MSKRTNLKSLLKEDMQIAAIETIARYTGLRKDKVKQYAEENNINVEKVARNIRKGDLSRDLMTALAGKPNNKYHKKIVQMYGEGVSDEDETTNRKKKFQMTEAKPKVDPQKAVKLKNLPPKMKQVQDILKAGKGPQKVEGELIDGNLAGVILSVYMSLPSSVQGKFADMKMYDIVRMSKKALGMRESVVKESNQVMIPGTKFEFLGAGMDKNGNHRIMIRRNNKRGESVQTNGNLPHTHRLLTYNRVKSPKDFAKKVSAGDQAKIAQELKTYFGSI